MPCEIRSSALVRSLNVRGRSRETPDSPVGDAVTSGGSSAGIAPVELDDSLILGRGLGGSVASELRDGAVAGGLSGPHSLGVVRRCRASLQASHMRSLCSASSGEMFSSSQVGLSRLGTSGLTHGVRSVSTGVAATAGLSVSALVRLPRVPFLVWDASQAEPTSSHVFWTSAENCFA